MSAEGTPQANELLAAELAFGLLDGEERRDTEARRRHDPDFAGLCATWNGRAAALLDGPDEPPGADLWARIAARLPANDRDTLEALRGALRRWRATAAGLGVIALGLGGAAVVERRRVAPIVTPAQIVSASPVVVILTSPDRKEIVSLSFDPASRRYTVASDAFEVGTHSAELWVIPADHVPRSLGLVSTATPAAQIAPGDGASRIAPGVTLAISLEPLGGSRTGKPTGPVVLTGRV